MESEVPTPRSRRAKVITFKQPARAIPDEMREFIDAVIVPALVEKYFAEHKTEDIDR